jgi:hypothetical protein
MPKGGTQPLKAQAKKETLGSDIRMGLGLEPKSPSFRARTAKSRTRQKEFEERLRRNEKRREKRGKKKRVTARMLFEQERAERLAKERAEGQEKRKAFEKKRGEETARRRRLLLNI